MIRTDLAIEAIDTTEELPEKGIVRRVQTYETVTVTTIEVLNQKAGEKIGKPPGRYITAEMRPFSHSTSHSEEEIEVVAELLGQFLPDSGAVLVAGIGNRDITPDALGPLVAGKILATRHISQEIAEACGAGHFRPVCSLSPGVLGQTGMEIGEIVKSVCDQLRPTAVIAVDALAAKSVDRLGCTIQISDAGISPGSGVANARKELSKATLHTPVISIGVPTVVDASTMIYDLFARQHLEGEQLDLSANEQMMVTPREIDLLIDRAAHITAMAINRALQPHLSLEDLTYLVA